MQYLHERYTRSGVLVVVDKIFFCSGCVCKIRTKCRAAVVLSVGVSVLSRFFSLALFFVSFPSSFFFLSFLFFVSCFFLFFVSVFSFPPPSAVRSLFSASRLFPK